MYHLPYGEKTGKEKHDPWFTDGGGFFRETGSSGIRSGYPTASSGTDWSAMWCRCMIRTNLLCGIVRRAGIIKWAKNNTGVCSTGIQYELIVW